VPRFPIGLDHVAVDHTLSACSSAASQGSALSFLLGDVFAPPFAPESFDILVTPWFVDILPDAFRNMAKRLGLLLATGGRWLSFGPLSFESVDVADRLTPEEMGEGLEAAGFQVRETRMQRVDYLHSPHSMTRRGEEIFVFAADRGEEVPAAEDFSYYPEWMTDGSQPIPTIPAFERKRAEQIFDVEILKCIDGQASIEDIVATLSSRYGLAPDRCRNTVNRFFSRMIEEDESPG
jgi:hypothetical protein